MISIVICSINQQLAAQVQKSIGDTIGVEWEAIVINNEVNPQSIAQVYNRGAAMARFDIICFVHEDVLFQTDNWGQIIVRLFQQDPAPGLIGVAGSKYKSKSPAGWYSGIAAIDCGNITHVNRLNQEQLLYYNPVPGSQQQEVVVLDGVLLCCLKKVWEKVRFNDQMLTGFHLYDIDFSFRVAAHFKVMVTYEINLVHLTQGGSFGNAWVTNTLLWHRQMKEQLPLSRPVHQKLNKKYEAQFVRSWLIRLKQEDISFANKIKWLVQSNIAKHLSAWPNVPLFLCRKYFTKKVNH